MMMMMMTTSPSEEYKGYFVDGYDEESDTVTWLDCCDTPHHSLADAVKCCEDYEFWTISRRERFIKDVWTMWEEVTSHTGGLDACEIHDLLIERYLDGLSREDPLIAQLIYS